MQPTTDERQTWRRTLLVGKTNKTRHGYQKGCRCELEIELRSGKNTVAPYLDWNLQPCAEYTELTVCGTVWNLRRSDCYIGGQCIETLAEWFPDNARLQRIAELWRVWHLNGMQAGTQAQTEALADMPKAVYPASHYENACEWLKARGLYEVPMPDGSGTYRYGSAWLVKPLPADVEGEIRALCGDVAP